MSDSPSAVPGRWLSIFGASAYRATLALSVAMIWSAPDLSDAGQGGQPFHVLALDGVGDLA